METPVNPALSSRSGCLGRELRTKTYYIHIFWEKIGVREMENLLIFMLICGVPTAIMTFLLCALWFRNMDLLKVIDLLQTAIKVCCDGRTQHAIENIISEYYIVKTQNGEAKDLPNTPACKVFSARRDYVMDAPVQKKVSNLPKGEAFACPADQQALKKLFNMGCADGSN